MLGVLSPSPPDKCRWSAVLGFPDEGQRTHCLALLIVRCSRRSTKATELVIYPRPAAEETDWP